MTLTDEPEGFVYVDYCTLNAVVNEGDTGFQRLHHSLEFNIDNKSYRPATQGATFPVEVALLIPWCVVGRCLLLVVK